MRRIFLFAALVAAVLTLAAGPTAANVGPEAPDPGAFAMEYADGRLTLRANGAPLSEVLRAVGAEAGFETRLVGDVSATAVSTSFTRVPLMEAIQRLVGELNWAAHYGAADAGAEAALSQLWVFGPGGGGEIAPAPEIAAEEAPNEDDRTRAADLLRRVNAGGNGGTVEALSDALREDESAHVRSHAALGLAALRDPRAVPALEAALNDASAGVRVQAIQALGAIGGTRAVTALGEILLRDSERIDKIRAAWALARQGTPLAQSYLSLLASDPDPLVRLAAEAPAPAEAASTSGGPRETR